MALGWVLPAPVLIVLAQVLGPNDAGATATAPVDTTQRNLIISLTVVVLLFLGRRAVMGFVQRNVEAQPVRYRWSKSTAYGAFLIGVLILLQVWFTAIQSLGTFLGLLSAGLAIALKDLVADLAGWFFILWRRPFELGDRIEVGGLKGDVVDRTIFQITIMEVGNWIDADQSTGRLIHIPNSVVFTQPLANYVAGFPYLWNELKVGVTFESDWKKAKAILEDIAKDLVVDLKKDDTAARRRDNDRFLIRYRKLTPIVYTTVADAGVLLTLRYICGPRERRGTGAQLWERILERFAAEPDIDFAPTQRTITVDRRVPMDEAPLPADAD
ncbi:MAG: mechanosensitive ion channel [Gemmatimonadetes bacterium]|nr:mechanosensitive ion channel [Gemmatimonadota bacterium]